MNVKSLRARIVLVGVALACFITTRTDAQTITTPASQVNQIVYVANAIDHLDAGLNAEKAALFVFLVKTYSLDVDAQYYPNQSPNFNPNADPNTIIRLLIQAQEKYDIQYRSMTHSGNTRVPLSAYDSASAMLGILAALPGNPVAGTIAAESINFQSYVGTRLNTSSSNLYLDESSYIGNSRVTGGFTQYRTHTLEKLYTLAQTNSNVATVIDVFFGSLFNASVHDTAMLLLNKNTALRDSQNFAPFVALIQPDGSLQLTKTQFNTIVEGFEQRMNNVVTQAMVGTAAHPESLQTITAMQKADYTAYYLNQNPANTAAIQQAAQTVMNVVTPMLQSAGAASYALPFTIKRDPKYVAYEQTVATLHVAADAAHVAADVIGATAGTVSAVFNHGDGAAEAAKSAAEAIADGIELSADTLELSASFGAFGKSDEEVIMDGINMLSEQLNQVQVQINGRLDIVDAKIDTLYMVMNQQFAAVKNILEAQGVQLSQIQNQVSQLQSAVNQVQADVFRLSEYIYSFANDQFRQGLQNDLITIDIHVRNATSIDSDTYLGLYSRTLSYATAGSLAAAEISDYAHRSYADGDLQQELSSGPFPEWNYNYLLEFVKRRFGLVLNTSGQPIANPRPWAMSTTGIMRLASADPSYFLSTTTTDRAANGNGFFGARNVGRNIENAVAACTVTFDISKGQYVRSPLFDTLTTFQQFKVTALIAALQAVAAEGGGTLSNQVNYIKTQWSTNSPTPKGATLQEAYKELDGSRTLLNDFIQLGLSHSLSQLDYLNSVLYSVQRLPDSAVVYDPTGAGGVGAKSLYGSWTTGMPNPITTLQSIQSSRSSALISTVDALCDDLAANTTGVNATGEPLEEVDSVLQRLAYYTLTRIAGHVQPGTNQGSLIPGNPVYLTFRSRIGTQPDFTMPVLLDASGNFNVGVPEDDYDIFIKADRYLVKGFYNIDTRQGNILLGSGTINAQLLTGDISADNYVDSTDLTMLRNAYNSHAANPGFDPHADFNGDGSVDVADFGILINAYGSSNNAPGNPNGNQSGVPDTNFNPNADANSDGSVDVADFGILINAYGTVASDPNYNLLADLNGDGTVDALDLALLQSNYGKHGDQ